MPTFGAAWALAAAIVSQQATDDQKVIIEKPVVLVEMPALDPDQASDRRTRERALTEGDAQKYLEYQRRIESSRAIQKRLDQQNQKIMDYRSGAYRARLLDGIRAGDLDQIKFLLADPLPGAIADLEARFNLLEPVVRGNQSKLIEPFVRAGFSLKRASPDDRYTLPMRAAKYGHLACLKVMSDLDFGSLSVATKAGTPLEVAALDGRYSVVRFLLHSGVPIPKSEPPLSQRALNHGYHKVAKLVRQHEAASATSAS